MKYTIKHGLITFLGLAVLAMLLPWSCVTSVINISGIQVACTGTYLLAGLADLVDLFALAGSSLGSFGAGFAPTAGQWIGVFLLLIIMVAPFFMTVISLFMSIFCNSKKTTIAMLVMQIFCALLGLGYIILLVIIANNINNVAAFRLGTGSFLYFASSVAAVIVSAIIVNRFVAQEPVPVDPSKSGTGVLCIAGEYLGVSIPLEHSTDILTIGRDATCCNLVLTGGKISRKHCEISYNAARGNYRVVDTSTNGTFVKGGSRLERDKAAELAPGTVLYLGNEANSFRLQ